MSSQLSMMKTRRTYSLMLFAFFLPSNMSKGALGHEEHALELELALDGEVLHREVVLPVVGEGLVEGGVLVAGDLVGGAHPDGLLLFHQVPLVAHLLHGLLLLLLLLLVLGADLLDLALLGVVLGVLV